MGTFVEELENLLGGMACRAGQAANASSGVFASVTRRLPGGELVAVPSERIGGAVEALVCPANDGSGLGLDFPPEFPGGNCVGVEYIIDYEYDRFDSNGDYVSSSSGTIEQHPIQVSGRPRLRGVVSNPFTVPANNGNGQTLMYRAALPDGSQRTNPVGGTTSGTVVATKWDLRRVDGQPDDCDPDFGNGQYSGPLTYDNGDGPVTIDVVVTVDNPIVDDDGNLIIPFVYVDPDLELNPEITVDANPELELSGNSCGNRDYDPDLPDFPSNEDDPEGPTSDTRYVGIVVSCAPKTSFPTVTETGDGDTPNLFFPRLGSVVFSVVIGTEYVWLAPMDINVRKQYLPVPGFIPAYGWEIKEALGWEITVVGVPVAVPERIVLS